MLTPEILLKCATTLIKVFPTSGEGKLVLQLDSNQLQLLLSHCFVTTSVFLGLLQMEIKITVRRAGLSSLNAL